MRAFYEQMFSNEGGMTLQRCGLIDDGHACALEYKNISWGWPTGDCRPRRESRSMSGARPESSPRPAFTTT